MSLFETLHRTHHAQVVAIEYQTFLITFAMPAGPDRATYLGDFTAVPDYLSGEFPGEHLNHTVSHSGMSPAHSYYLK